MNQDLNQEQQYALQQVQNSYKLLGDKNIVTCLAGGAREFVEWDHYPEGDVRDLSHHTQYFYHCHPSSEDERVKEHGHIHVFFRQDIMPSESQPVVVSEQYEKSSGCEDNLTHLFAIAINEYGYPCSFFTVNHWVVLGAWYDAVTLASLLDQFYISGDNRQYHVVDHWLTHMIKLFKGNLIELLHKRDSVINEYSGRQLGENVYYDKNLEVTSVLPLV